MEHRNKKNVGKYACADHFPIFPPSDRPRPSQHPLRPWYRAIQQSLPSEGNRGRGKGELAHWFFCVLVVAAGLPSLLGFLAAMPKDNVFVRGEKYNAATSALPPPPPPLPRSQCGGGNGQKSLLSLGIIRGETKLCPNSVLITLLTALLRGKQWKQHFQI